jgi:hypothetical protein
MNLGKKNQELSSLMVDENGNLIGMVGDQKVLITGIISDVFGERPTGLIIEDEN